MNKSMLFRKNDITRMITRLFPLALLCLPVMTNAKTTIDQDTTGPYAFMGDTEYVINPGVTMSAAGSDSSVVVMGKNIESIINNGTIKSEDAPAMEVNIDSQTSSMLTIENAGTISSNTTAVEVEHDSELTIINSGIISGGQNSITFSGQGANALVLKSGSDLTGDVTSTDSVTNTITLNDSGNEEVNFIGINKGTDGFKSLIMDGTKWTLTGDVDLIGTGTDSLYIKTGELTLGGDVTNKGGTLIDSGASLQLGTGSGGNATLEGNIENDGTLVFNQGKDFTWRGDISGTGSVTKQDANTLTLSGNNTYSGDTTLNAGTTLVSADGTLGAAGSTATITIDDGATLASAGSVNNNVVIANGGTLAAWNTISGNSTSKVSASASATGDTITGNVTNKGTLEIGSASSTPGTHFVIDGNYTGDQGSMIVMDTVAGDDSSVTDHLDITGNSAGSSKVEVTNVGGMGAKTLNGIELVSVGGTSDASFTLDKQVVAGAWEYNLNQHSDGNWYLESSAYEPEPVPDPDDGGDNGGGDNPPEIYRPEVGVYVANYIAAQQMFQHKRDDRDQLMLRDEHNLNTWMYVKGQYTDGSFAHNNLDYDITSSVVQLGSDFLSGYLSNGAIRSGFMLGVGHSDTSANAKNNPRSSSGNVDGYNVGLYATWQQDQNHRLGSYIDTWIAYSWYQNEVLGKDMPDEQYSSQGGSASVEVGHAWVLPSSDARTLKFEPQIQAIYSSLDQNDHTEYNGTQITTPDSDSLTTRLGMRMGYVDQNDVEAWQPYVGAHWISGNGQNEMNFNGETIDSEMPEDRFQAETGITGNLNPTTTISLRAVGEWGENSWSSYSGHVLINHRW